MFYYFVHVNAAERKLNGALSLQSNRQQTSHGQQFLFCEKKQ